MHHVLAHSLKRPLDNKIQMQSRSHYERNPLHHACYISKKYIAKQTVHGPTHTQFTGAEMSGIYLRSHTICPSYIHGC